MKHFTTTDIFGTIMEDHSVLIGILRIGNEERLLDSYMDMKLAYGSRVVFLRRL